MKNLQTTSINWQNSIRNLSNCHNLKKWGKMNKQISQLTDMNNYLRIRMMKLEEILMSMKLRKNNMKNNYMKWTKLWMRWRDKSLIWRETIKKKSLNWQMRLSKETLVLIRWWRSSKISKKKILNWENKLKSLIISLWQRKKNGSKPRMSLFLK